MKAGRITIFVAVTVSAVLAACVSLAFGRQGGQARPGSGLLTLELKPDRESYLPGELVTITCRVVNNSGGPVALFRGSTVRDGYLKVFVSDGRGDFKEYRGPGWGARDADFDEPITLEPGQAFETEATVLWNQRLETAHLSKDYAESLGRTRITADYAFPDPGVYSVKAVLYDPLNKTRVESEPTRLVIETPRGGDLEVWNAIKGNGQYALFMQTGGLAERPTGPKTKAVAESLEGLLKSHANSRYSNQIGASLNRRRAMTYRGRKQY